MASGYCIGRESLECADTFLIGKWLIPKPVYLFSYEHGAGPVPVKILLGRGVAQPLWSPPLHLSFPFPGGYRVYKPSIKLIFSIRPFSTQPSGWTQVWFGIAPHPYLWALLNPAGWQPAHLLYPSTQLQWNWGPCSPSWTGRGGGDLLVWCHGNHLWVLAWTK